MSRTDPFVEKLEVRGDDAAVGEAAARWWSALNDPPISEETAEAFQAWITADPRHREAFEAMEQVWESAGSTSAVRRRKQQYSRRQMIKKASWAAGACVLGSAGLYTTRTTHLFADQRTATGKTKWLNLPDGSSLEMSTRTALDVRFSSAERTIHLYEGEVYCKVAKDLNRSFCVRSSDAATTALGTEFCVRCIEKQTRIAVTQHAVRVTSGDTNIAVREGEAVSIRRGVLSGIRDFHASTLAWRSGRLEFLSSPLGDVVDELNQWQRGTILLERSALARLPLTMLIDLNHITESVRKFPMILPVKVIELTPYVTVIRSA